MRGVGGVSFNKRAATGNNVLFPPTYLTYSPDTYPIHEKQRVVVRNALVLFLFFYPV